MDIKRTRELLGIRGKKLTDDEIIDIEERLRVIANTIIDTILEDKRKGIKRF